MKFLSLALLALPALIAAQQQTGLLGPAARIENNPQNVTYQAVFNQENGIKGKFTFKAGKDGNGVAVSVRLEGFDDTGKNGPFKYHIHDQPVAADGNCSSTKAHLDPYQRGQVTPCNIDAPETCEVGDLTGKHLPAGIPAGSDEYSNDYTDAFLSLISPSGAFIGNRSITIHDNTTARIACVNISIAPSNSTIIPNPPKNNDEDDDDDDDEDDTEGKGAGNGNGNGNKPVEKDGDADSGAGVLKSGILGLGLTVVAVVGLVL